MDEDERRVFAAGIAILLLHLACYPWPQRPTPAKPASAADAGLLL